MAKLPKFTVGNDSSREAWRLRGGAKQIAKSFCLKANSLQGGVLNGIVEVCAASAQILNIDGTIQQERTNPCSVDPKKSRG